MRYFRYEAQAPEIHLYPLVCWHVGAKQSSEKFIDHVIKLIQDDPLARWIYMGDAGECVTKNSKGNIYEQLMNPGDQLRVAADLLMQIQHKGLFGIRGNHGNRIDRESGIGWDEMLCSRIGIPYLGVSAIASIVLPVTSTSRLNASIYVHHGSAGSISPAGKLAAGKRPEQYIVTDVILTAHTHMAGECSPVKMYAYADARERKIKWGRTRTYVCGSAYDSRSGYAEEKQYPPLCPEHIIIDLKPRRVEKNGIYVLDISHRTIQFEEEFTNEEELDKWEEQ